MVFPPPNLPHSSPCLYSSREWRNQAKTCPPRCSRIVGRPSGICGVGSPSLSARTIWRGPGLSTRGSQGLAYWWASGVDLDKLLDDDMAAGDFVRTARQILDVSRAVEETLVLLLEFRPCRQQPARCSLPWTEGSWLRVARRETVARFGQPVCGKGSGRVPTDSDRFGIARHRGGCRGM